MLFFKKKQNNTPAIIKPCGEEITLVQELGAIDSIQNKTIVDVEYVQLTDGSSDKVEIVVDKAIEPYFKATVQGTKVSLNFVDNVSISNCGNIKVKVFSSTLSSVELDSVGPFSCNCEVLTTQDLKIEQKSIGAVFIKNLQTNNLLLINSGVGDAQISGKCENLVIKQKSIGSINVGDLIAQAVDVEIRGVGSSSVYCNKSLNAKISSIGGLHVQGAVSSENVNLKCTGLGAVTGLDGYKDREATFKF